MSAARLDIETRSADETADLGAALAGVLSPGDVVLLEGDLGAGKTTFAKGVARGLGVADAVTSPTFVVARHYAGRHGAGRVDLAHLDLYRVPEPDDETEAMVVDTVSGGGIAVVEWPWEGLDGRVRVRLAHRGGDRRLVAFETTDQPLADALRQLIADARTRHLDLGGQPGAG